MPKYQSGDYLKVEFKDERAGESEWMWVKVDYCDDSKRIAFGWLDSEPILDYQNKLKLGSRVAVSYGNIRQHAKARDFERAN
jgi:hypothetical protein